MASHEELHTSFHTPETFIDAAVINIIFVFLLELFGLTRSPFGLVKPILTRCYFVTQPVDFSSWPAPFLQCLASSYDFWRQRKISIAIFQNQIFHSN